ncbi:hypothetical protein SASPL_122499 [Salvia splendens]|uniref:AB hydrolase-1 domain-containing protein n=1 Tax=Salvia splendens TaxID=180675 RepID=A0A8X8ZR89_SALSN|nr:uncharacterized protein LOC121744225 [Salvia splendens]KAG6415097.1 hypothetical protein SASPL_122499 [Salvia splendens]
MSEVNNDFEDLLDEGASGIRYSASSSSPSVAGDWRFQAAEFAKGAAEMSVEFGKGVRDVVKQTVLREDSLIMKKFKGPCQKLFQRLRFLNEYLPEDRDPLHAWTVIAFVSVLALAVLTFNMCGTSRIPLVNKMKVHPSSASIILLPDGRRLAYQEQGVPADRARHSMIVPHSFLSSRLAGVPRVKGALLEEFGIRLVTYDLPGFGESDPDPKRNLESSAMDILHLAYAVNVTEKLWVLGYSDGSKHAWAALNYIPDRIAGAIILAPMVNPYDPRLSKAEIRRIWGKWTLKRRLMYTLARKFPRLLPYFYRRSFLSGNHGELDTLLSVSLGKRDRAVVEDRTFRDVWHRNIEESVRQGNVRPFVEEAILQVSNWGFSIGDLNGRNKYKGGGVLDWIKSLFNPAEKRLSGFFGPIHIWHGDEDTIVPPSMSDFVQRDLPDAILHKLPYEGHFSYFYMCDECHRQIFTTVFGHAQGPLIVNDSRGPVEEVKENGEAICSSAAANEENLPAFAEEDDK